jgi:hypothetical protein
VTDRSPGAGAEAADRLSVAVFVSEHGFGHAARASALMAAIGDRVPATFHLYSAIPAWFFRADVPDLRIHPLRVDVGLVQATALDADLDATVERLDSFLPFDDALVDRLAADVAAHGCRLVMCDIAPLGIAVARAAGVPSLLVENFTWSWIYRWYAARDPRMGPRIGRFADLLGPWFDEADWHVQTAPVCDPADCDLTLPPIARPIRASRESIRAGLGIDDDEPLVFLSMGGVPQDVPCLDVVAARYPSFRFVVAGHGAEAQQAGNVTLLPADSGFSHPSLINAADLVVGKLGYSTIAEVWQAGVPFAGVSRDDYPEMAALEAFVVREIAGTILAPRTFREGRWLDDLARLLDLPRISRAGDGGAVRCARFVLERLAGFGSPGRAARA